MSRVPLDRAYVELKLIRENIIDLERYTLQRANENISVILRKGVNKKKFVLFTLPSLPYNLQLL